NVLISLGHPRDLADHAVQILMENCDYVGFYASPQQGLMRRINLRRIFDEGKNLSSNATDGHKKVQSTVVGDEVTNNSKIMTANLHSMMKEIVGSSNEELMHSTHLRKGLQIDVYQLIKKLGSGYSSEVWSAKVLKRPLGVDLEVGDDIAIKIFRAQAMSLPDQVLRVEREFRIAQRIRHANLVRIYEYMLASRPNHCFVVMDLARGKLLKEYVTGRTLGTKATIQVVHQVASALHALHEADALHRDVKPSNISVNISDSGTHATLLDLGIVSISSDRNITVGSRFMGSKHWAPLEQLQGHDLDSRSDLYSLGAVAFSLLTGTEPFHGSATEAAIALQMNSAPLKLPPVMVGLPSEIRDVINACLSSKPDDRPSSAIDVAEILEKHI
ncbi:MAG: serine/threonine protein kinase, partial [Planctomycetia bacterium]|nr:serine/threonine protein kinase [Planctomycetia bacterium]